MIMNSSIQNQANLEDPYNQALLGNIENRFNQETTNFYTDKENNNDVDGTIGISFNKKFDQLMAEDKSML